MSEEKKAKGESKIKKFFAGLAEKLDKKLEEKSKNASQSRCGPKSKKGSSCCS